MAIKRIWLPVFLAVIIMASSMAPVFAEDDEPDQTQQLAQKAAELLQAKKYDEAIAVYLQLLKIKPDDELSLYNLACAYALAKKPEDAAACLLKSVEAGLADFELIQSDPDLQSIRTHDTYKKIISAKETYQKKGAERKIAELKKQYGPGYSYEVDDKRKLIWASDASEGLMNKIQDFINKFADAERHYLFCNKPSYYITILVPNLKDFQKLVPDPRIGGYYAHHLKTLICRDTSYTLRHEFTHALHFADISARKQVHPIWITEGLSTCFEESELGYAKIVPKYNARIDQMKEFIKNGKAIPWDVLSKMNQKTFMEHAVECYAEARAIFYWLDKTDGLRNFYYMYLSDLYANKDNFSGIYTLEKIYGKKIERIEDDWKRWIEKTPATEILEDKNGTYLGVNIEPSVAGMIITVVGAGSPAEKAGLKAKDVILKIGPEKIDGVEDYVNAIRKRNPGDTVTFYIFRDNAEKQIKVKLGKRK
ncbi:MAG: PDZ domain-containing protein [Planctomycetota bacterium]